MTSELIEDLCNRLQTCSLALETITDELDRAIVLQRVQNVVKQLSAIGKVMQNGRPAADPNGHLGSRAEGSSTMIVRRIETACGTLLWHIEEETGHENRQKLLLDTPKAKDLRSKLLTFFPLEGFEAAPYLSEGTRK